MKLGDRTAALARLATGEQWDVVVVCGGITGAGILREAARRGLSCVLIEQRDFAWGTSSRSSKMVHGGLRYLGAGQLGLARKAVRERDRLIAEAPGLVEREENVYPLRRGEFPGRIAFGAVLTAYDVLSGGGQRHRHVGNTELLARAPGLRVDGLRGAYVYVEGLTDDARLVLRVLGEAVADGALAVNYVRATGLERRDGRVTGVEFEAQRVDDAPLTGRLAAKVVIDATGAWAKSLEPQAFDELRVRPLRGSHLVLRADRLGLTDSIIFMHPGDGRPVFVFPWQGRVCVGTTDVDHDAGLQDEARISDDEVAYLHDAVEHLTGDRLTAGDMISTWSGVRPVLSSGGGKSPSQEKRDEAVWSGDGIVCAGGGKLTTFRLIALEALAAAAPFIGYGGSHAVTDDRVFVHGAPAGVDGQAGDSRARTLTGRFGAGFAAYQELPGSDDDAIDGTTYNLAELCYATRNEMVEHLDDLLLRRTRLGNLLDAGGAAIMADVERICHDELGWDATRWRAERERYEALWRLHYAPPEVV